MVHYGVSERDWKIFRQKVPVWQENYMDRLNKEYIQLLSGTEAPSNKFWKLDKRIREDRKKAGVVLDMRRSKMEENLIQLIDEDVISLEDLAGFSDELRERMNFIFRQDPE